MFTSSFYAVLFLAAVNANAAVTGVHRGTTTSSTVASSATAVALDPNVMNCFITLPQDPLSATGLSTPFILQPPCSMAVATQQAFAEAAVYDPATGKISIYHPLVLDSGVKPAAPNVVPVLPANAVVGIWFGFNGNTLQLLDTNGKDANASPILKAANCINGNPGVKGDIFGQVSWCNAEQWFKAANAGIASGLTVIPPLGNDKNGNICPTTRSFKMTDQDPSDNVPTQYLLVGNATAQDTDANRNALGNGEVINNASDEALLTNILDPLIGCTPVLAPSLDNNGAMVPALVLSELQASVHQPAPVAFVPKNDPDCLSTSDGAVNIDKTNAYRLGVGQPLVGTGDAAGDLDTYCNNLVAGAPPFLKEFEQTFTGQTSPDAATANNLFTFLGARYLASLTLLTCPPPAFQPVVCKMDANGVTTSCVITLSNSKTTTSSIATTSSKATTSAKTATSSIATTSSKATTSAKTATSSVATTSSKATTSAKSTTSSIAATSTKGTTSSTATTSAKSTTLLTSSTASVASVKFSNSTIIHLSNSGTTTALTSVVGTTTAAVSSTSSSILAATTSASVVVQVVEVEIVSFFIFVINLGGALPPSVLSSPGAGNFIVLEEEFIELAPACSRACNHQYSLCASSAALPHATFAVSDCQSQENNCLVVATTQTPTATTPATVKATATVAHAKTSVAAVSAAVATTTAAAPAGTQVAAAVNNVQAGTQGANCALTTTATITNVLYQCTAMMEKTVTATVTVTASSLPSVTARHAERHARAHRRAASSFE